MRKITNLILLFLFLISSVAVAQDSININIRDNDISRFQKVKLYLDVLDKSGAPINNLDSSNFSILEKETGKKTAPHVENFYSSTEPMAVLFSIDASNSMYGSPLNNIKEGILTIISDFRKDDKMGIAYFHNDFYKKASFDTDRDVLRNNIKELQTGGDHTELFKGAIESIKWLTSLPEPKRKILVLISDGEDNGNTYKIDDVINEVKKSGLTVFTIGSTADDAGFLINMQKIAEASVDGKYYKISKPEDIKVIIPTLYERIKKEYILNYFTYTKQNTNVNAVLDLKLNNQTFSKEFTYTTPSNIVENAPSISFFKTKEFLYGSIGAGVLIIALAVFMFLNINKKKQFKKEKEEERKLREQEAQENEDRFNKFKQEYDNLLDNLENQKSISQADKEKIALLERNIEDTGKTLSGAAPKIDYKRRTMILEKGGSAIPSIQPERKEPYLLIKNGYSSGKKFLLNAGTITIGRVNSTINIPDDTVSRQHARIYYGDGKFVVEDLNSTNGTFVNDYRITKAVLNFGDTLKIGTIELLFGI